MVLLTLRYIIISRKRLQNISSIVGYMCACVCACGMGREGYRKVSVTGDSF